MGVVHDEREMHEGEARGTKATYRIREEIKVDPVLEHEIAAGIDQPEVDGMVGVVLTRGVD